MGRLRRERLTTMSPEAMDTLGRSRRGVSSSAWAPGLPAGATLSRGQATAEPEVHESEPLETRSSRRTRSTRDAVIDFALVAGLMVASAAMFVAVPLLARLPARGERPR